MTFDEQKEYIKANNKIDPSKFNKTSDITNMIDFINKENEEAAEKDADRDITEISKFLVRNMDKKYFIMNLKEPGIGT